MSNQPMMFAPLRPEPTQVIIQSGGDRGWTLQSLVSLLPPQTRMVLWKEGVTYHLGLYVTTEKFVEVWGSSEDGLVRAAVSTLFVLTRDMLSTGSSTLLKGD